MKSEVIEKEIENEYPKMMISAEGRIVLFSDARTGMVIGGVDEIGRYSDSWGTGFFVPFYGKVILSED